MDSESPALATLLPRLGWAVLARGAGPEDFAPVGELPGWFATFFGSPGTMAERSDFLEQFLGGDREESGVWEEAAPAAEAVEGTGGGGSDEGMERAFFEAKQWEEAGRRFLAIANVTSQRSEQQKFVQAHHEEILAHERLHRELECKQILLECIMHDLGNPASVVLMNLQHVLRKVDRGERHGLQPALNRALSHMERQRELIREIGEVFAAEFERKNGGRSSVELRPVLEQVAQLCQAAADPRGIHVRAECSEGLRVAGHPLYLERVLQNLLFNAIRHSPEAGLVEAVVSGNGRSAEIAVMDRGRGIGGDKEKIFEPFVQGEGPSGKLGLGLYFCRMTVELWGGSVTASDRSDGGAVFTVRLPLSPT